MRRSAVVLLMLFAMLWQSVAMARVGSTVNVLADGGHAALHWQDVGHHHLDDGSLHVDDSSESVQHVVGDHVSAPAALLTPSACSFPPLGSAGPHGLLGAIAPHPFLEGPLRPPRPAS